MGKTFHSHACTSTHLWHVKILHILVKYLQNIVCMLLNYLPILYAVTTTPPSLSLPHHQHTHTYIIQDNYKTKQRVLHTIIACESSLWLSVTVVSHKLIYRVLKYAVKNKHPRLRSAFTYWEEKPISRLDLGKTNMEDPSLQNKWRMSGLSFD